MVKVRTGGKSRNTQTSKQASRQASRQTGSNSQKELTSQASNKDIEQSNEVALTTQGISRLGS